MHIKLRHLEVFNALFEAGSVSRAAERLNLSQPAVSIALSNLEDQTGFRLFHRDRGFFAPTHEALLLRDEVQQGITALARVDKRAEEIRSGATGAIRVATNGAMSYNFLPRVIADFQRDFPDTYVELRVHSSRRIAAWVASRQIDIGLTDAPVPVAGLEAELFDMECVCIMREDDPLSQRDVVTPQDLDDRPVIAVTGDHSVDRQLQAVMSQAGARLHHTASSYYYAIARHMVASGRYVAVIDPVNGKAVLGDGVVWRPFAPRIVHELAAVVSRGRPLGIAASNFKDRINQGLSNYVIERDNTS
ncbi:MAG: LysR substrate-binding domain-containing protein [Pseudomonadota bacterium]